MACLGSRPLVGMTVRHLTINPSEYQPHHLHGSGADWPETNCATDLWIEILHSWRLDPVAGLAFTMATDFDGEQWTMFTYPEEDLRLLYGIEVHELNVWRSLLDHVEEHLQLGHVIFLDVDAYYLPDTAGITYRSAHQKTTVGIQAINRVEGSATSIMPDMRSFRVRISMRCSVLANTQTPS